MLTQEKAEALISFLRSDDVRAEKLGAMDSEAAAKAICADGLEITAEELAEFAEAVKQASETEQSGELDENALENVSGGGNMLQYMLLSTICKGISTVYKVVYWAEKRINQ